MRVENALMETVKIPDGRGGEKLENRYESVTDYFDRLDKNTAHNDASAFVAFSRAKRMVVKK